ncbi:hypothetical protein SeMB42_g02184 [Synchytrium endobioticum]|nr:hypothetical protein SeMB42_g02184 [Synchytrium endobioticum]
MVYSSNSNQAIDKKRLYGLVCESLKYRESLNQIIDASNILKQERRLSRELAIVLCHDLLIGNGVSGRYKASMGKHRIRLQAELVKLKVKKRIKSNTELIPSHIRLAVANPRYVRVNTIKTNISAVQQALHQKYALNLVTEQVVVNQNLRVAKKTMMIDPHIPNLLLLPPNIDLHEDDLFLSGKIILQDKASCFPAYCLNPKPSSIVIDACAAPGNKTSHLSMLMGNKGTIHAFDMDARRLNLLKNRMCLAGCTNVIAHLGSFLAVDPKTMGHVDYILLDPSCSGSGMLNQLESSLNDEDEQVDSQSQDRLKSLSDFQLSLLDHALSFETAKRVVYSTCSIHQAENEDVVVKALANKKKWRLMHRVLPSWKRRGLAVFDGAEHVIRVSPTEDLACGFFVAVFERV